MQPTPHPLRPAVTWADWLPAVRTGIVVAVLFVVGTVLTGEFALPIRNMLAEHTGLGIVAIVATSVVAVLLPMLTNLPLLPLAVLAYGPWWTALLLLAGWVGGAALSFWLGRQARDTILHHFPSVQRHADIDRMIHPRHRIASLVVLRMTFPVDVLSYALGLFSRRTTLAENVVSTAIGAAPFALLFAWFPALSASGQVAVFLTAALLFAAYAWWVLHHPSPAG